MSVDDPLDYRETNPGTWKFVSTVKALESAEEALCMREIKTNAVVGDEVNLGCAALQGADADDRRVRSAGKFPCVLEEILHDNSHQGWIGADAQASFDCPLHGAAGGLPPEAIGDVARYCT